MQEALGHHLFLGNEAADPGRRRPRDLHVGDDRLARAGRLHLSSDASLARGPWISRRAQLGTPSLLTHAWILRCPVSRAEKPSAVARSGRRLPRRHAGEVRYRVLEALGRMARRLAGGCACPAAAMAPVDADSAVGLTVCRRVDQPGGPAIRCT